MKFRVDDRNRCRLVRVKFHLNRCRSAVAVAKCLVSSFFGTQCSLKSVSIKKYRNVSLATEKAVSS